MRMPGYRKLDFLMSMTISQTTVKQILTRCTGYLTEVSSHSLQPYRGCSYGNALCGVGCYVQHNPFVTKGREWGSFLEVRTNAAEVYLQTAPREKKWAREKLGAFSIFCSSSTDPFVPQEKKFGITKSLLEAMLEFPPDRLILQTHSAGVLDVLNQLQLLNDQTELRVHISIESDCERLPELPPPAATVSQRLEVCGILKNAGVRVVVTVAPLLPIKNPVTFFEAIKHCADGVVIDHFIGGDGSKNGIRTRKTELYQAMWEVHPKSVTIEYREQIVLLARQIMPGCVGVGQSGFAGHLE